MVLCELENDVIKGYELSLIPAYVKKYKESELSKDLRIYSATTNTPYRIYDTFRAQDVNKINYNDGSYHVLSMYTYDEDNLLLYGEVFGKYINGDYDSLPVITLTQSMELNDIIYSHVLRVIVIDDYVTKTVYPYSEIYCAKTILEINEKLHFLQLLLQNDVEKLSRALSLFDLKEDDMKKIFDNFDFSFEPVFSTSVKYVEKMQQAGLFSNGNYETLSESSAPILKLVRSSKK